MNQSGKKNSSFSLKIARRRAIIFLIEYIISLFVGYLSTPPEGTGDVVKGGSGTAELMENISKSKVEHVLINHTAGRMQKTVDAMMEKGLRDTTENLVNSKGFFNTSWSEQTVIDSTNQAYKEALTKGIPSGSYDYTTTILGENITLNFQDGVFKSAWGDYKLNLNDFGY